MIQTLAERWPVIAVVIACVAVLAFAGGAATNVGPWYKGLKFPRLKPPDWAFGPGWTLIYVFIASSAVVGWYAADAEDRTTMIWLFAVNAVLNVLWSSAVLYAAAPRLGPHRVGPVLAVDRAAGDPDVLDHAARRLAHAALPALGHVRGLAQLARRRAERAF